MTLMNWIFTAAVALAQTGYHVADVEKGSPLDKLGLQKDDVVTELNGKPFTDSNTDQIIKLYKSGEKIRVKVIRDQKPLILHLRGARR